MTHKDRKKSSNDKEKNYYFMVSDTKCIDYKVCAKFF